MISILQTLPCVKAAQWGPISESYQEIQLPLPSKPAPATCLKVVAPVLNVSLAEVLHTETEGLILLPGHCTGIFAFLKSMKSTALLNAWFSCRMLLFSQRQAKMAFSGDRKAAGKNIQTGISFWFTIGLEARFTSRCCYSLVHWSFVTSFGISVYIFVNWQFTHITVVQKVQFFFLLLKERFQRSIRIINLFWRRQKDPFFFPWTIMYPASINQSQTADFRVSALDNSLIWHP